MIVKSFFAESPCHLSSGQSGLGKSTLVNTIFASHLIESKGRVAHDEPPRQTTEIETVGHSMYMLVSPSGYISLC